VSFDLEFPGGRSASAAVLIGLEGIADRHHPDQAVAFEPAEEYRPFGYSLRWQATHRAADASSRAA